MNPSHPVRWIKSSYSGGSGTECVEVTSVVTRLMVRDSKCPAAGRVSLGTSAWTEFMRGLPGMRRR
jgi:hypothetical protein